MGGFDAEASPLVGALNARLKQRLEVASTHQVGEGLFELTCDGSPFDARGDRRLRACLGQR